MSSTVGELQKKVAILQEKSDDADMLIFSGDGVPAATVGDGVPAATVGENLTNTS